VQPDVHVHDVAPAPAPATADVVHTPAQPTDVQDDEYAARVAYAVQRETAAIRADLPAHVPDVARAPRPSISERRAVVRDFLQKNRSATGDAVHKALLAAGHDVKLRTAYNDRDAVLSGMA
jgi:hypothetical protein